MMSKMRNPFGFFIALMKQPILVPIWVFMLMCVNVASIAFWSAPLAKIIFVTFMVSAAMMMGLYSLFGFEKILGLGHVLWIPLLLYILTQLPNTESGFFSYLIILSLSITVSLVFDIVDTWKYFSRKYSTIQGKGI